MGWFDYHLHLFRVTSPDTGEAVQIGIPDEDVIEGDEPILPGWEIPIAPYFPRPRVVARYEYDFGDGWEHDLTLEAIRPQQPGQRTHDASAAPERVRLRTVAASEAMKTCWS